MGDDSGRRYFKELRLQQFRGFCETARRSSFASAAAALGLSRPAVWHQIRALEREFGTRLVIRRGRGIQLTDDGQLLLELVSPLVSGFDSVKSVFEARRQEVIAQLVVATTASNLLTDLKEPIKEFRRSCPQVHLYFLDRPSAEAFRLVEKGQADLAVASQLREQPRSPQLEYESLFARPFLLICPRGHKLARKRTVHLTDLVRYPFVLTPQGSGTRSRLEQVFQTHDLLEDLDVALDTSNGHLIHEYVALGLGITVAAREPVGSALRRKLHIRSVAGLFGEELVVLATKKGAYQTPHAGIFSEIVRRTTSTC